MSAELLERERPRIGGLLAATFVMARTQAAPLAVISGLLLLPFEALYFWVEAIEKARPHVHVRGDFVALLRPERIASWCLLLLMAQVTTGVISHLVMQASRGRKVGVGASLAAAFKRPRDLFFVAIATTTLVFLGMALCLVPALFVGTMLAVAIPVCVLEGANLDTSFRRSRELTHRCRLAVGGAMLALGAAALSVSFARLRLDRGGLDGFSFAWVLFVTLSNTIQSVFAGVTYVQLRRFKEGGELEQTAAVFD